jgi:hypothetical protein
VGTDAAGAPEAATQDDRRYLFEKAVENEGVQGSTDRRDGAFSS